MARRHDVGAEIASGVEEIGELDRLVAGDTGDRRLAGDIALGEQVDDLLAEPRLVVEYVMGDAETGGHVAGVVNVAPGTAGTLAMGGRAMIVELQRDAEHVIALALQQRGHDGGIDAARHGDDNARLARRLGQAEAVESHHRGGCEAGGGRVGVRKRHRRSLRVER